MNKNIPNKINWEENCKVRLALSDSSMDKHDIIKILLVRKLKNKYKNQHISIYTEYPVRKRGEERFCDVYFENRGTKEVYCYEIQKEIAPRWLNGVKEFYKDWDKELSNMFWKTADLVVIPIKDLSDNIQELSKQLDEYII